jgi:hypothetical protein
MTRDQAEGEGRWKREGRVGRGWEVTGEERERRERGRPAKKEGERGGRSNPLKFVSCHEPLGKAGGDEGGGDDLGVRT